MSLFSKTVSSAPRALQPRTGPQAQVFAEDADRAFGRGDMPRLAEPPPGIGPIQVDRRGIAPRAPQTNGVHSRRPGRRQEHFGRDFRGLEHFQPLTGRQAVICCRLGRTADRGVGHHATFGRRRRSDSIAEEQGRFVRTHGIGRPEDNWHRPRRQAAPADHRSDHHCRRPHHVRVSPNMHFRLLPAIISAPATFRPAFLSNPGAAEPRPRRVEGRQPGKRRRQTIPTQPLWTAPASGYAGSVS